MSLSSFKGVWLKCTPHIKVSTARSDVCFLSEKQRNTIREPVTDAEKLDATVNFPNKHSDCRAEEKQKTVTDSITVLQGVVRGYGPSDPCSKSLTKAHYTFDFSQQIDCFASWVHFISWHI